jgi:predicted dehydrogenase
MARDKLRMGIVGASPERGWFTWAHLPALQAPSDRIEITAVCTSRMATATAAADLTAARWAFDDYRDLVTCDEVDLAVICVKTPLHAEISEAALAAGRNVYCEWPLGRSVAEADPVADLAHRSGLRNLIGLQGRASPVINTVRELINQGYIGRLMSTAIVGSATAWGAAIDPAQSYIFDASNGASMLRIVGGHLLDALCHACGDFREVGGQLATRRPRTAVLEMPELEQLRRFEALLEPEGRDAIGSVEPGFVRAKGWFTPTSPDHLALNGVLDNGAIASVHVHGGNQRGLNFLWNIVGDEGELQVTGDAAVLQIVDLKLRGARGRTATLADLPVMEAYRGETAPLLAPAAANVWRLYKAYLGEDTPDTVEIADFAAAIRRQRLLETIEDAAARGEVVRSRSSPVPAPLGC